jgi:hypothetical protein
MCWCRWSWRGGTLTILNPPAQAQQRVISIATTKKNNPTEFIIDIVTTWVVSLGSAGIKVLVALLNRIFVGIRIAGGTNIIVDAVISSVVQLLNTN